MPLSDRTLIERLRSRAQARKIVRLTPATALRLAAALTAVAGSDRAMPPKRRVLEDEFPFAVERWSVDGTRFEEVLARFKNVVVARTAYLEAARMDARCRIRLRHGVHVLEDSHSK
jgi:hypothetical protein